MLAPNIALKFCDFRAAKGVLNCRETPFFLERVLQSELDLAVVGRSVGDRGTTWHVDGNLRTGGMRHKLRSSLRE